MIHIQLAYGVYAFNSSHSGSVMEKWVSAPAAPYPYVIRFSNDTIVYGRYDGVSSPSLSFSSALLSTEFVHATFSSDGSTRSLFSNGVLVDSGPVSGSLGSISNSDDLYIGKRGGISVRNFNGLIDDIRIYDRALSASEVTALYIADSFTPIQIVDSNVTAVSSHGSHALFQKTDGSLWAMGANDYGQLGDGTTTDRHTPVKVVDRNVTASSAGGDHSRFVQADGSLWAMGRNHAGQLGDGTTTDRLSPLKVLDGNVTSIASGTSNGIVKTESGQLLSMGQNDYGQSLEGSLSNLNSPKTYFSQTYEYPSAVSSIGSNVVLEGGKIYHMDAENNQLQIFDTNASSWSTGTSPNFILDGTSAVFLNDKIYAVGGQLRSQIAWYKFDGDFNDSSGNNLILSDNGVTLTSDRNGDAEHALNFDGTDDSFSINYGTIETPESNFAYAFWAKPLATTNVGTQTTSGMGLYSVGNRTLLSSPNRGDDRGFGFSIGTNTLNVINHGSGNYFSSLAYTADLSGWNHYLFICQNNKASLYLNGSFIKNGQQLSQTQISHRSYGRDEKGTYFKGQIDSLRIFSKNLSADEISLLWDIENTSGSTTLLKEYNPQTDSWADKSSHSFFLHDSASVAVNGGLFQVGGIDENGSHSNRVFHFDGSTEVWSEKASMITARSNHALLVHDAKIWAVGGTGLDGNATNSVEVYDPDSESWSVVSSLSSAYEGSDGLEAGE